MMSYIIHCETLGGKVANMNPCRMPCGIPKSTPLKWSTMAVDFVSRLYQGKFLTWVNPHLDYPQLDYPHLD